LAVFALSCHSEIKISVDFSLAQGWMSLTADVAFPHHPPMEKAAVNIEGERVGRGSKTHTFYIMRQSV